MEYNTQRTQLKITDYGRSVAKLIEYAKGLPTREERTAAAEVIVGVMSRVNPGVRHTENYRQQLWEHLMILADWQLDVECPYRLTPQEEVRFAPRRLNATPSNIHYRHYGRCLEDTIRRVSTMPEGEDKELLTAMVIAQMKKSYLTWNNAGASPARTEDYNDVILKQLDELSQGRMHEGSLKLEVNPALTRQADPNPNKKKKKKKKK